MPNRYRFAADTTDTPVLRARPDVELQPRGELRVEKFLAAATDVFFEKGYRGARLADIVQRAGGSLATLYRAFGDKEGLAYALMERSIFNLGAGLQRLLHSDLPPEQALQEAAEHMVGEILSRERIVCHRIVLCEGLNQPEMRDWFRVHGVVSIEKALSDYFARETAAGRLAIESPDIAATAFYMIVFGSLILRSVNGVVGPEHLPVAQAEARERVKLFCAGALPRTQSQK